MFVQEHPVITLWLLWLLTVPTGPLIGLLIRKNWRLHTRRWQLVVLSAALLSLCISFITLLTKWSLRGFWADAVNLALAYVAVWILCSIPYQRLRWLGENGRLIVGFPSMLLALFVYTNLPFVIIVDGMVPNSVVNVKPGVTAVVHQFGWETMNTDIVELVRRPRWFPIVEHTLVRWVNSDETCGFGKLHVYAEPKSDAVVSICLDNPRVYDRAVIR